MKRISNSLDKTERECYHIVKKNINILFNYKKQDVIYIKLFKFAIPLLLFLLVSCGGSSSDLEAENEPPGNESVIRVLVPGNERSKGFMASGFRGFSRIKSEISNVDVGYLSDISETSEEALSEALRKLGGNVLEESLKDAERDENWLQEEMTKLGFLDLSKLYCVEWTPERGFFVVDKDGETIDLAPKEKIKEIKNDSTV